MPRDVRIHVLVSSEAIEAIDELADEHYDGNRSAAINDAIVAFSGKGRITIATEKRRLARSFAKFIREGSDG